MEVLLSYVHVFIAIAIIVVILLQEGKAGMGVSFGGGGGQSVFGSSGAGGFLVKVTVVLALLFGFTSVGLSILGSNQDARSVMERVSASPMPIKSVVANKEANTQSQEKAVPVTSEKTTTNEKN